MRMADGVVNAVMCAASPAALEWSLLLACCYFLWASHGLASSNWELSWARQAPTIMRQPLGVGQRGHDGGVHALHASPAVLRTSQAALTLSYACMHAHIHTHLPTGLLCGCIHSLCPNTSRVAVSVHAVAGWVEGAVRCSVGTGMDIAVSTSMRVCRARACCGQLAAGLTATWISDVLCT